MFQIATVKYKKLYGYNDKRAYGDRKSAGCIQEYALLLAVKLCSGNVNLMWWCWQNTLVTMKSLQLGGLHYEIAR